MTDQTKTGRRVRISEKLDYPPHTPFVRATAITEASVYWMPVNHFPIPFRQRQWILDFLERLTATLAEKKWLPETFLQLKYTRTTLNKRFTQTLMEYEPVTGLLIAPGQTIAEPPTSLEIKKLVDNPNSKAEIDLEHLSPDYCAWFLTKKEGPQRQDFFGVGGMVMLWVEIDQKIGATKLPFSKALTSHPDFAAYNFDAQFRKLQSMSSPWLKRSKEVFAHAIREEPFLQGLPFVLPRLDSVAFRAATPEQLTEWASVFHAYCTESERDEGIILAIMEPDFDEALQAILDEMRAEKMEYPL